MRVRIYESCYIDLGTSILVVIVAAVVVVVVGVAVRVSGFQP